MVFTRHSQFKQSMFDSSVIFLVTQCIKNIPLVIEFPCRQIKEYLCHKTEGRNTKTDPNFSKGVVERVLVLST